MTLRTISSVSLWLGVLSLAAVVLANLALIDIYHGEPDVTLEWNIVRTAFMVILPFHAVALTAAWKGRSHSSHVGRPN